MGRPEELRRQDRALRHDVCLQALHKRSKLAVRGLEFDEALGVGERLAGTALLTAPSFRAEAERGQDWPQPACAQDWQGAGRVERRAHADDLAIREAHMRPARLAGMTGIGVDRMGELADAAGGADVLRLENLDTDVLPLAAAVEATRHATADDAANSYLPFVGQTRLRRAVAAHVARLSGAPCDAEKNVIVTAGGLSGILNVLLATSTPTSAG